MVTFASAIFAVVTESEASLPAVTLPSRILTVVTASEASCVAATPPVEILRPLPDFARVAPSSATVTLSALTVIPSPAPTFSVLPLLVRPSPAVTWPSPLNWTNTRSVAPTSIGFAVDSTQAVVPLVEPSSTKT